MEPLNSFFIKALGSGEESNEWDMIELQGTLGVQGDDKESPPNSVGMSAKAGLEIGHLEMIKVSFIEFASCFKLKALKGETNS